MKYCLYLPYLLFIQVFFSVFSSCYLSCGYRSKTNLLSGICGQLRWSLYQCSSSAANPVEESRMTFAITCNSKFTVCQDTDSTRCFYPLQSILWSTAYASDANRPAHSHRSLFRTEMIFLGTMFEHPYVQLCHSSPLPTNFPLLLSWSATLL